jgi:iron(III) transport system substrate-binding protein
MLSSAVLGQSDIATYQGADRTERLVAGGKKEGTVSIYSSATTEDLAALTSAFEKKYGVKTTVWRASSEDIIQRAVTEARGGRFAVDVVETDDTALEALNREQLLQPVKTPHLADLVPQAIPADGSWIGDRLQIYSPAYNTDVVKKADLPKSFEDLLDPKWKGKLGIEADDYDWFATVVTSLGEQKGLELFRNIVAKNGISVRKGHTLLANLVVSGEVPLALTTYLYKVQQLKDLGAPVDWFTLPPTVARSQGVAMARKAAHPNAAVLFIDFLLSDGQAILAKRDFFPTNIKVKPLPQGIALTVADPVKLLDEGDKWQKLFKEIVTNQ